MKQSIARGFWILLLAVSLAGSIVPALAPETSARGIQCFVQPDSTRSGTPVKHPAEGTTVALVVFVRFLDDDSPRHCSEGGHAWPCSTTLTRLPTWADSLIDPAETDTSSLTAGDLTHFFWEMSGSRFLLYGDVYDQVVIPPESSAYYDRIQSSSIWGIQKFQALNSDVLHYLDDSTDVDFSLYDNNPDDDTLDVVFLVYRWVPWLDEVPFWGWAGLFSLHEDTSIVVDESIVIVGEQHGSGTVQQGLSLFDARCVAAHEYGHLLCEFANAPGMNDGIHWDELDRFGLMAGGQDGGNAMSAFERLSLGWLEPDTLSTSQNHWDCDLADLVTTGKAYLIPTGAEVYEEYFLLENRQRESYYEQDFSADTCRWCLPATGLLISHVILDASEERMQEKSLDIECADGMYARFSSRSGWWVGEPDPECGVDWIEPAEAQLFGISWADSGGGHADAHDTFNEDNGTAFTPYSIPNTNACYYDFTGQCDGMPARFKQDQPTGIGVVNIQTNPDSSVSFDLVVDMSDSTIGVSTTWSGFVLLDGDLIVESGDVLTIAPGTAVRLADKQDRRDGGLDTDRIEIIVEGTLNAEGLEDSPIFFRPDSCNWNIALPDSELPSPGDWYGIVVRDGGEASLKHCDIGYGIEGVRIDGSGSVTIDSCSIYRNSRTGICIEDGNPIIRDCVIANNDSFGVYVAATDSARMRFCVLDSNTTHVKTADKDLDLGNMAWPGPGPGNAGWNTFTAGTTCLQNTDASADSLLAHGNYWGSDDSSSVASRISGNVDYDPWLPLPPDSISAGSSYAYVVTDKDGLVRALCPLADYNDFILKFVVSDLVDRPVQNLDPGFLYAVLNGDVEGPSCPCGNCEGWDLEECTTNTYEFLCQSSNDTLFATDPTDTSGVSEFVDNQVSGSARLQITGYVGPVAIGELQTVWINSPDLVPCGDYNGCVSGPDFSRFADLYNTNAWYADFIHNKSPGEWCVVQGDTVPTYLVGGPDFAWYAQHYHGAEDCCSCE